MTLSRLAPSATAGFAATPGKSIRACGPPWVLPVAPLHPACSRALGASDKKGAASAAPFEVLLRDLFGEVGVDQVHQRVHRGLLVGAVADQRDGGALHDAQRENAQ